MYLVFHVRWWSHDKSRWWKSKTYAKLRASWISFELLLYFGNITRIYSSIFHHFHSFIVLLGVNGELIFTVEELRVSFFLNESHFRISCCFSFFNLAIFLCNLSSLHFWKPRLVLGTAEIPSSEKNFRQYRLLHNFCCLHGFS